MNVAASFVLLMIALYQPRQSSAFFGSGSKNGRVLLRDIGAITLRRGQMTAGRRSSPVPHLECLSGCRLGFSPDVVQCHNTGWDGNDVQWECRADMDNSYRFGHISVSCEGYDYPDDPYILAGSCGLRYTIELTEEGRSRGGRGGNHDGYYEDYQGYGRDFPSGHHHSYQQPNSNVGSWTVLIIVALIAYGVYRFKHMTEVDQEAPSTSDYTDSSSNDSWKSDHYTGEPRHRFGQSQSHSSSSAPGTNTGNGFWTGAAAGGLLGYLFGRNNGYGSGYHGYGHRPRYGYGYGNTGSGFFNSGYGHGWSSGSGWFSGSGWSSGGGWSSGSGRQSSHSSGSRTSSGFGGTTRR